MLTLAETYYGRVLEDQRFTQRSYALYKMGFVHYNQEAYEKSIAVFKELIEKSAGDKVDLKNKGLTALVTSFAEVKNGWRRAKTYFDQQGDKKFVRSKLTQIAKVLAKNGDDVGELEVYEDMLAWDKKHPSIAEYAERITANYNRRSMFKEEEATINRFVQFLDPSRAWYLKNKEDEVARVRANQYREDQVNRLINHYYESAQKLDEKNKKDAAKPKYMTAAKYFEMYIALFPEKTKELYEKEFFLAEIYYFQAKDWDQAAAHYKRVVELDKAGKYSADAAYSRLLARNEKMADAGWSRGVRRVLASGSVPRLRRLP